MAHEAALLKLCLTANLLTEKVTPRIFFCSTLCAITSLISGAKPHRKPQKETRVGVATKVADSEGNHRLKKKQKTL